MFSGWAGFRGAWLRPLFARIRKIPREKARALASALLLKARVKSAAPLFAFLFLTFACRASDLPQRVLAEVNLARTAPHEYAQLLTARMGSASRDVAEAVRFLEKARPMPPLAFSPGLSGGAYLHVADQGPRGTCGHNGSGWGNSPWSRMSRYGQFVGYAGENIFYGSRDARGIVCSLIIDSGVSGRGHRKNIFNANFGVAGVACGPHANYGAMCVMDFASSYIERGNAIAGL